MTTDAGTPEHAAAEWFIALRENPDDAELRARFADWRDADPRHATAWAGMEETARMIAAAPAERRSYDLPAPAARATPPWRRGRGRRAAHPRRVLRGVVTAAAVACLALIAAPTLVLRMSADHVSGAGQVETIRLADGSTVALGPDSAIAVDYGAEGRNIRLLAGRAMFEVRRDPARPFSVAAREVTATVLGTGFEVRMIGEDTGVAVRTGRVRVEAGAEIRELGAGDWARVGPDMTMQGGVETAALVGEWRSGRIALRNQPIAEAIDEIRPWYGGRIILADRALGRKLVSGAYDVRDPQRGLELVVAPYGGQVTRITPWLMIVTGK